LNDARQTFVSFLRTHREQHGITLPEIAESTKIGLGLLEALERDDLSRWPKGIFRRAFFREYVAAIGLSPEPLLIEFVRLFPDEPGVPVAETPSEFRLSLDAKESGASVAALKRAVIVAAEVGGIALAGAAGAWLLDASLWTTSGAIALAYYPISNLCVDRKLGLPSLRLVMNSQFATPDFQGERDEEIEGHEELQVSF
jgi:hypothetical protein